MSYIYFFRNSEGETVVREPLLERVPGIFNVSLLACVVGTVPAAVDIVVGAGIACIGVAGGVSCISNGIATAD